MNLHSYIGAAFPAVAIETFEEERFTSALLYDFPSKPVFALSASGGLRDLRSGLTTDAQANFSRAFAFLAERSDTLLLVFDWQHVARNAMAYRALKDGFNEFKARGCCVILVAPRWTLPPELEHDVPILQWQLPTRRQLYVALQLVADSVGDNLTPEEQVACLDSAAGLTLQEAENAFALSLVECGRIEAGHVAAEKMRLIRSSGYLEVWPPVAPDAVGGLGALKSYFEHEVLPARDDDELRVRGLLLVGIPGSGKSLSAKAAGALLGWPVLRMDFGSLKGSLVGQSEGNMRAALRLAEAVAPCVLWCDELEKGIGGYQSSAQSDSGVTLGMVGTFLSWLQEHRAPILTIATANNHAMLPAELTRAGRFDEQFFVDVPSRAEREQIARIHLLRFGCVSEPVGAEPVSATNGERITDGGNVTGRIDLEALAAHIADLAADWTGAEIEQCLKSAARRSRRQPTLEVISACALEIRPIVRTRAAEFEAMRSWARGALRSANTPETREAASSRKVARPALNGTAPKNDANSDSRGPNLSLRGTAHGPRSGGASFN